MADITMCSTTDCPLSKTCYRKLACTNEHWQSYCAFSWCVDHEGNPKCDFYEKCEIVEKDA